MYDLPAPFDTLPESQARALDHVADDYAPEDLLDVAVHDIGIGVEAWSRFGMQMVVMAGMRKPDPALIAEAVKAVFEVARRVRG